MRDHVTGLVWSVDASETSWTGAASAAAGYARCGYTQGWRVPTRRELLSIVHNGAADPAIDGTYFPATAAAAYWSADAHGADGSRAWYVDFADGAPGTDVKGATHALRLVVKDVNRAPAFTKGPDQTVLEDAGPQTVPGWATDISTGDMVTQGLRFIVEHDNPELFAVPPAVAADGTLTYTPADDAFGRANVSVRLVDDGGVANGGVDRSPPQSFVIDVMPVNDPPRITLGPDIDLDQLAAPAGWRPQPMILPGWASIAAGPANESDQQLTVTLTLLEVSDQQALVFSAAPTLDPATGTLSFTVEHVLEESNPGSSAHTLDWFSSAGLARVKVELKDDGGTANGGMDTATVAPSDTFTIFLDPVPKAMDSDAKGYTRGKCIPLVIRAWDADTDFRREPDSSSGELPDYWLKVRYISGPSAGYILYPTELFPNLDPWHKDAKVNFVGGSCYAPVRSNYVGFDTITYVVVDKDGNESKPAVVSIEVWGD